MQRIANPLQVGASPTAGSIYAWLAQLVERNVANVQVAGSNPVPRTLECLSMC